MSDRPTPETDAAANESIVRVYETSKRLERQRDEWHGAFLLATKRAGDAGELLVGLKRQRDELLAACEWAVSEFGKHTRPSPLDKAIAAAKGGEG